MKKAQALVLEADNNKKSFFRDYSVGKSIKRNEKKHEMAEKMKKGKFYKKEIDNKKPFAKKDSERFEENGGMSK